MIGSAGISAANLEVITIELICEVCGTSNPPGTEFCTNCNSYLAWDRSAQPKPAGQPAKPTSSPPTNPAGSPPQKQWTPQTPPPGSPAGGYPNAGPADQGYPNQGYAGPGSAGQGYNDSGYNQGAYYQGGYYQGGAASGSGPTAPTLEQPAYTDMSCPSCGTINPNTRRFCTHCGYAFFYGEADPYAGYGYTSPASQAAQDRAARKAYRRSLPPLYRWRRVLIGVLVVALLVAAAVVLRQDPVGIAKGAWYSLRQEYDWVRPVQVAVVPPDATAAKSDPAALVDESENEWTMNWTPSGVSTCGPAPGTGYVVLTFAPTRIRLIQIAPGLAETNPQRKLQPLPKVLGISFDNGPCQTIDLTPTSNQQEFKLDSEKPVTQVLIGISSAYPVQNAQPLISLTEVILKAYPS
jgi:hypothetical protein